jgi:hypothetical protein
MLETLVFIQATIVQTCPTPPEMIDMFDRKFNDTMDIDIALHQNFIAP